MWFAMPTTHIPSVMALLVLPALLVVIAIRYRTRAKLQWVWSVLVGIVVPLAVVAMANPAQPSRFQAPATILLLIPATVSAVLVSRAPRVNQATSLIAVFVPITFWLAAYLSLSLAIDGGWAKL
jgi:hypothetical protein